MWAVDTILKGVSGTALRVEKAEFTAVSTDSRTIRPGELFIPLKGPNFDGHLFIKPAMARGASGTLCERTRQDALPRSGGTVILVDDTNSALTDLASAKRKATPSTFVAITGSNGKTTTKELLVHIASGALTVAASEKNYNNQVGVAKTLLAIEGSPDFCILELGTNHKGEMAALARMARPHVSLITNVAPSHLEGFTDLAGVAAEKLQLFRSTLPGGTVFVNADDPSLSGYGRDDLAVYSFGMRNGADFTLEVQAERGIDGYEVLLDLKGKRVTAAPRLVGRHNLYNVLAASALSSFMGVPPATIADRIGSFEPYRGRFRPVRSGSGYLVVDDTYNANPASMEWAIRTLASLPCGGKRVAILGDMMELGEASDAYHGELARLAASAGLSLILVFGLAMKKAAKAAGNGTMLAFDDKERLIEFARGRIGPDDIVLVKGSRALGLDEVAEALA